MMRCRITPRFTSDGVRIVIDWVDVIDEKIANVIATEEFVLNRNREGCSYITRGSFDVGNFLPGTFWMDEQGHRHFIMQAEPGYVGLFGQEAQTR